MNPISLLKAALEDNSGGTSSMRLMCVLVVAGVLSVWVIACYQAGTIVDLGTDAKQILALAFGAKFAQRAVEKPAAETPVPAPAAIP